MKYEEDSKKVINITDNIVSFLKANNTTRDEAQAVCSRLLFEFCNARRVSIIVETYSDFWKKKTPKTTSFEGESEK